MRRLAATMRRDVMLQARYGLYAVSVLVVVALGALLAALPSPTPDVAVTWVPVFVVGNLIITTFFFMAASVLLERDEGTVAATVTTPLRDLEYLGSKTVTLAVLGLIENGAIVLYVFGWPTGPLRFAGGVLLVGALYALLGFVSVARYASINQWLMPSVVWITLLMAPLLGHFGMLDGRVLLWHPVEPGMALLRGSYGPVPEPTAAYGWIGSTGWVAVTAALARHRFARWVVRQAGVSA